MKWSNNANLITLNVYNPFILGEITSNEETDEKNETILGQFRNKTKSYQSRRRVTKVGSKNEAITKSG